MRSRRYLFATLVAVLTVAIAVPFALAAADDDIPGVAADSPAIGSFSDAADTHDVYSIPLLEGHDLYAGVDATSAADISVRLYSPDSATLATGSIVASSSAEATEYPREFTYRIPTSGSYYLDVYSPESSLRGSYMARWMTDFPGDTGGAPGVGFPPSPVRETLEAELDLDDVYRVWLSKGQTLSLALTHSAARDFDLFLFPPGVTNVADAGLSVASSESEGTSERITYRAPRSGYYLVDAYDALGSGAYALAWTRKDGQVLTKSPTGSTYTITRRAGRAYFTFIATDKTTTGALVKYKTVYLQRSFDNKRWATIATLKTSQYGKVIRKVLITRAGAAYYRWYSPADGKYTASASGVTRVVVR